MAQAGVRVHRDKNHWLSSKIRAEASLVPLRYLRARVSAQRTGLPAVNGQCPPSTSTVCPDGQRNVNGVCVCADGSMPVDGVCQTSSRPDRPTGTTSSSRCSAFFAWLCNWRSWGSGSGGSGVGSCPWFFRILACVVVAEAVETEVARNLILTRITTLLVVTDLILVAIGKGLKRQAPGDIPEGPPPPTRTQRIAGRIKEFYNEWFPSKKQVFGSVILGLLSYGIGYLIDKLRNKVSGSGTSAPQTVTKCTPKQNLTEADINYSTHISPVALPSNMNFGLTSAAKSFLSFSTLAFAMPVWYVQKTPPAVPFGSFQECYISGILFTVTDMLVLTAQTWQTKLTNVSFQKLGSQFTYSGMLYRLSGFADPDFTLAQNVGLTNYQTTDTVYPKNAAGKSYCTCVTKYYNNSNGYTIVYNVNDIDDIETTYVPLTSSDLPTGTTTVPDLNADMSATALIAAITQVTDSIHGLWQRLSTTKQQWGVWMYTANTWDMTDTDWLGQPDYAITLLQVVAAQGYDDAITMLESTLGIVNILTLVPIGVPNSNGKYFSWTPSKVSDIVLMFNMMRLCTVSTPILPCDLQYPSTVINKTDTASINAKFKDPVEIQVMKFFQVLGFATVNYANFYSVFMALYYKLTALYYFSSTYMVLSPFLTEDFSGHGHRKRVPGQPHLRLLRVRNRIPLRYDTHEVCCRHAGCMPQRHSLGHDPHGLCRQSVP